jgi:hypothetical protein
MWIASIIHLTDMHLYTSPDGSVRRPDEHEAHVAFMLKQAHVFDSVHWRRFYAGLSEHNARALRTLRARMPEVIADERQDALREHGDEGSRLPIIVAQTGDVEAYGARKVNGKYRFPGWEHVSAKIAPLLDQADEGNEHDWVDLFGNHDAWGGAVPLTRPLVHRKILKDELRKLPGIAGPWPERYPRTFAVAGNRTLELYRASTVPEGVWATIAAKAKLTPHPLGKALPLTKGNDGLAELAAAAQQQHDSRAIRLLLLHHPLHAFRAGRVTRTTTAAFSGRTHVARVIRRVPFHLVIAGHRHELDPAEGGVCDAAAGTQRPLPTGSAQLVAESPTYDPVVFEGVASAPDHANSFAVYRLLLDDQNRTLSVRRRLFRYLDEAPEPFFAGEFETVVSNLRLK